MKRLKQTEIAKNMNLSPQMVNRYFNMHFKNISIKFLKSIYLLSLGKIDPNTFLMVDDWKEELKALKQQEKSKKKEAKK
jgi:transcriptional regulator with XRE-family HTH domain